MSKKFWSPVMKRFLITKLLGLVFGGIIFGIYSFFPHFDANLFEILFSYLLIGVFVGFAGYMKYHPLLKFRFFPFFRGFLVGGLIIFNNTITTFWPPTISLGELRHIIFAKILIGAIVGGILDFLGSKFGGEGEELLK